MSEEYSCLTCPNKNCFIQHCNAKDIAYFNHKKIVEVFRSGQMIILENTLVENIYFVLSGKVKVYSTGVFGKQQIIRFAGAGNIIGHRGINRKKWFIAASTLEDTKICSVSIQDFMWLFENNAQLSRSLLLFFSDELYRSEMKVKKLATLSVRERVADALVQIKDVFSPFGNNLGVELSRQDIADYAGTTKEQVSKYLSELKNDKIIDLQDKNIIILNNERIRVIAHLSGQELIRQ